MGITGQDVIAEQGGDGELSPDLPCMPVYCASIKRARVCFFS